MRFGLFPCRASHFRKGSWYAVAFAAWALVSTGTLPTGTRAADMPAAPDVTRMSDSQNTADGVRTTPANQAAELTQVAEVPIPAAASGVRREFMEAMARVVQHVPDLPDSTALESFPIYGYLRAARLRRDLAANPNDALDAAIDAFLRSHPGEPVGRALRRDWLASLADRRLWSLFLPRAADTTDAALVCDRLAGRLAIGATEGLAAEVLARWSVAQKPPEECSEIFAWLHGQNLVTPELAVARVRTALAANNAKLAQEFTLDVPAAQTAPLFQWIRLLENPKSALTLLALDPKLPVEAEALLAGYTRLCFTDTPAALNLLPQLLARPDVSATQRDKLRRVAALGSAASRLDGSLAAFAALPEDPNDIQVQEWRVRAALWAGDYPRALEWLQKMPATLAQQPRWRYWRARATDATAGTEAAAPLYLQIAGLRDYYGYLAADRLGHAYELNVRASPSDPALQRTLAAEPAMVRAHSLFDCDMTDDAAAEFATVVAVAKPAVKVQAARLASDWGWYSQTIATLAQAGEWDDVPLRYPRPYSTQIADASRETSIAADWLLGIMRQESLFRRDAVSRADARGLMQMLPGTATAVARRWHLPPPTRTSLFEPDVAIALGAAYFKELLDRYSGQLALGLAAYNAGPVSVSRWEVPRPMDADVWIENIPYAETRAYVQHILEHIVAFAAVRNVEPPHLAALLKPIDHVH